MSEAARRYLQQLRTGVTARSLPDQQRLERIAHVERFIKSADSSIQATTSGRRASLDDVPETPEESAPELLYPDFNPFVQAGTFTDLCLECKNASSFVETKLLGILTSLTQAIINVDGRIYNPSSGTMTCFLAFCSSTIDLSGLVDCRAKPASGTASGTASYLWKFKLANVQGWGDNTWASDDCVPFPPIKVNLSSSEISVGATSQASANCSAYLQWSSSAPAVASVSDYGVVTGHASGTAEISATCGANRGSATIKVNMAEEQEESPPPPNACDDPMTPAAEECDDPATQYNPPYATTYTRTGSLSDLNALWYAKVSYAPQAFKIFCDVTDWFQWNTDYTIRLYLGTVVNSCWAEPYNGTQH